MRTLFFLITLFFISCGTDQGETKTYTYTVRNESGVQIKILAYYTVNPSEVLHTTLLDSGEQITKNFQDGLPPRGYDFRDFFGNLNGRSAMADSIKVIYNNTKFNSFNSKDCNGGNRNPLNTCAYQGIEETFIFTIEDYDNAKDCNGNCE
jgi:hypothetical protein